MNESCCFALLCFASFVIHFLTPSIRDDRRRHQHHPSLHHRFSIENRYTVVSSFQKPTYKVFFAIKSLKILRHFVKRVASAATTTTTSTMGSVFGKENVAEPAFEVLFNRSQAATTPVTTSYEIRQYGKRFTVETSYGEDGGSDNSSPFRLLANYIGVFGNPQNEGNQAISMTAPVMMSGSGNSGDNGSGNNSDDNNKKGGGVQIAMTAPVMMSSSSSASGGGEMKKTTTKTMEFVLPAEYDDISKIPKPTNPNVHVKEIPAQVGVIHRYNGSMDDTYNQQKALQLANQLRKDGLIEISDEFVLQQYQFWGYNPPFCLPYFRRNEIWIELSHEQVEKLIDKSKEE